MKNHIGVVLLVGFFMLVRGQIDSSAPWPTLRGDQARTGQSTFGVTVTSSTPQVQWHRTLGGGAGQWSISGAILEDGSIIVSGTGEYPRTYEIFSFDTSGRQQWTYSYKTIYYNPGSSGSPIVGTGDQIFWNVPAEALMSFDAKGNLLWKKVSIYNLASGDSVLNENLLYGFNFAFNPSEETLRGFNGTDGVVTVNTTLIGTSGSHISLSNAERVYIGSCDVVRCATLDGELLFATPIAFGCFSHLSINNTNGHSFGVANFYKSNFGRRVFGFDSKGSVLWNYTLTHHPPDGSFGDGVAIYQGLVFVGSDGLLAALDQTSGDVVWQQIFSSTTPVTVTAPVVDVNGQLFVIVANEVSQHATIWGFNALTGDKIYQSDDVSCTVYGIGAVLAIGPSNSFVLICRSTVFYFA